MEGLGARDSEGKSLRLLASFHRRDPSWFLGVMMVFWLMWLVLAQTQNFSVVISEETIIARGILFQVPCSGFSHLPLKF